MSCFSDTGNVCRSTGCIYNGFCMEKQVFKSKENPCCNERKIPVILVMTSNAPDTMYEGLLKNYQQTLNTFIGPTEVFVSGDTLQISDYSKLDWKWSIFDPESKKARHETVFPQECSRIFEMGKKL